MASDLSPDRQRSAVGQGLALGAVMAGIPSITGQPLTLELDFRRAWNRWVYAQRFPAIKTGPAIHDVLRILADDVRSRRRLIGWSSSWPFVPYADGEDWDDQAELIDGDVPAEGWHDLAKAWVGSTVS